MKKNGDQGKIFATAPRRLDAAELLRVSGGSVSAAASKSGGGQDNQTKAGFQVYPSF